LFNDTVLISVTIGFILDFIIGDPVYRFHPVILIGKLISLFEGILYKENSSDNNKFVSGCILWIFVCLTSVIIPVLIIKMASMISIYLRIIFESIFCYQLIAAKSLKTESMKVYKELVYGDINSSRKAVSMIVGRDTQNLDEKQVTKAAVETVAENTSDGVVAPVFYMMIFGAAGGFLYKAVNTMDSMIGYKNDRYLYFGRVAAIMDDIFNFIPSRIAALLMIISALILNYNFKNSIKIFIRDRFNHKSPNSAQTEAVCAGALDVELAGDAYYFGKLHKKPYIGDKNKEIEAVDIIKANNLMYLTSILMFIISAFIRMAVVL